MPTYSLRPPTLADRLQDLSRRLQELVRQAAAHRRALAETRPALATRARWQALPSTRRWQVLAALSTGLVLLTMYVLTLQAAVERGEKLREERRQQGLTAVGALAPAATLQRSLPGSTRT